jgi:hypothetical protein
LKFCVFVICSKAWNLHFQTSPNLEQFEWKSMICI